MDVVIHTFVHLVPYIGKNVIEELHSALVYRQHTPHVQSQWCSPFLVDIPGSAVSKCFIYGPHLQQARLSRYFEKPIASHDSKGITRLAKSMKRRRTFHQAEIYVLAFLGNL